jgi:hypothetical protein
MLMIVYSGSIFAASGHQYMQSVLLQEGISAMSSDRVATPLALRFAQAWVFLLLLLYQGQREKAVRICPKSRP